MIRRFTAAILTGLLGFGAVVFAQKQATMLVTVVATESGPVTNLTAKDFKGAQVTDAVRATEPLSIELLIDVSRPVGGAQPPLDDIRRGAQAFVETIRAGDPHARLGLVLVSGAPIPSAEVGASAAAIDKAVGMIGTGPDQGGNAAVIEAIQGASQTLANEPAPRRAVVSIDFTSADPMPDPRIALVVKDVFKTGVTLWAIGVHPVEESRATNGSLSALYASRDNALNNMVKANGGQRITIINSSGLKAQLQAVANSLLSQYELTINGVDASHAHDLKLTTASGAKVVTSVFAR
jgi:hypothetical protein